MTDMTSAEPTMTTSICLDCDGDGQYDFCPVCADIPDNCDCPMEPNGDDPRHYIVKTCESCDGSGEVEEEEED